MIVNKFAYLRDNSPIYMLHRAFKSSFKIVISVKLIYVHTYEAVK